MAPHDRQTELGESIAQFGGLDAETDARIAGSLVVRGLQVREAGSGDLSEGVPGVLRE
jgi:hypothetical protein